MKTTTVEALAWVLIYGGLLAVSVGVFVLRLDDAGLGWVFVVSGAVVAVAGAVLIVLRSRMVPRDDH